MSNDVKIHSLLQSAWEFKDNIRIGWNLEIFKKIHNVGPRKLENKDFHQSHKNYSYY